MRRSHPHLLTTLATLLLAVLAAACSSVPPTLVDNPPTLPPAGVTLSALDVVESIVTATPLPLTATPAPTPTPPSDAVPCPLTGLDVSAAVLAARRPLLVQIGNSNPERPQFGLQQADMVFETLSEGGITRFSAIYLCQDAAEIAGVRSGRLVNLQLVPMFDAIFAHVGASEPVQTLFEDDARIRDSSLDFFRGHPGFFQQPDRRRAPFDVFTGTQMLWEAARQRGIPMPGNPPPQLNFSTAPLAGGQAVQSVTVMHHSSYWVRWKWQADENIWYRALTNDTDPNTDTPFVDAATGRPLTAANVLVIRAIHEPTDIIEDSIGSRSIDVQLIGSGAAVLLRDGQLYEGSWQRGAAADWFTLTLADGSAMQFAPGNTYVHFYPTTLPLDFVAR